MDNIEPIRGLSASGASGRKKSVAEVPVTSILKGGEFPIYGERELTADEEILVALGYKPEFKREFSLWTTFCVSFAVLGLLPSFASTLYYVRWTQDKRVKDSADVRTRAWDMQEDLGWCGVAHCHVFHPMCCYEHGRAVLLNAYKWRTILRCSGTGTTGLRPISSL